MMHNAKLGRLGAVLLGTLVALLLFSSPAWAHVTIVPDSAPGGDSGMFTFQVPNERADASTGKVEVIFPRDYPITSVTVQPVAGWNATVRTRPLDPAVPHAAPDGTPEGTLAADDTDAVSSIVWEGGEIGPGETGRFTVSMGPLPDSGQLVFKALQTYSDGAVQRWIEEPDPSGVEPEHPAAVLTVGLAAPGAADPHAAADPYAAPPSASGSEDAGSGFVLPGVIAFTGLLAVSVVLLYRRASRPPAQSATRSAGRPVGRSAGPPEREPTDFTRS